MRRYIKGVTRALCCNKVGHESRLKNKKVNENRMIGHTKGHKTTMVLENKMGWQMEVDTRENRY